MEKHKCAICGCQLYCSEEIAHVILKESHDNGEHEWEICQDCADDAFWVLMNRRLANDN